MLGVTGQGERSAGWRWKFTELGQRAGMHNVASGLQNQQG
jgi:hypothetical protein